MTDARLGIYAKDGKCPCPHGIRPSGPHPPEFNTKPAPQMTRIGTDPNCRIHNEHLYVGDGDEVCRFCGLNRFCWSAHRNVRTEMIARARR